VTEEEQAPKEEFDAMAEPLDWSEPEEEKG